MSVASDATPRRSVLSREAVQASYRLLAALIICVVLALMSDERRPLTVR